MTKNQPIYSIQTGVDAKYDAEGNITTYQYPEIGWTFRGESLGQAEFNKALTQYFADYVYLEKPALWVFENPDALFEPENPHVKALGSLWTVDGIAWNVTAVKQFIQLWTPKIVLGNLSAVPNHAQIEINGTDIAIAAYMLFDNNYVRLRDVAMCLKDTDKQFDVQWNSSLNCVDITTGRAYEPTQLDNPALVAADATYSTQAMYLNGEDSACTAYLINGNNYVRLRDLSEKIGFQVTWDGTKIHIQA